MIETLLNHSLIGDTSQHSVWSVGGNLFGILNGSSSFQGGNYNGSAINLFNTNIWHTAPEDITPFTYTCFPAGTKIKARRRKKDGSHEELDLEIEKLNIGDEVLSWNGEELEWKPIEQVFERENNKLIKIKLANNAVLEPTPEHPFYVQGKWIEAKDLEIGMQLLASDLSELEIIQIEHISLEEPIKVYNFKVKDNHNYFAVGASQDASASFLEGVLVHNDGEGYGKTEKVLKGQVVSIIEIKDPAIRLNQLQAIERTLDDLIEITKNDNSLIPSVREFALSSLDLNKEFVHARINEESMELIYNRPIGDYVRKRTNEALNSWLRKNSAYSDFEQLVKLGYGGAYTMKELERDKLILQYLLAGEFAIQRTGSNPLLWLAQPLTQNATWFVEMAYHLDGSPNDAVIGGIAGGVGTLGGIVSGSALVGAGIGFANGGPAGATLGALIGGGIGGIGGIGGSLVALRDLQKIQAYKRALDKEANRAEKDKIVKIPPELDYNRQLAGKPDLKNINGDLTDWFQEVISGANQSPELEYMQKHKGTKEQWILYLELCRTHGSWDLKEYISPVYLKEAQWTYKFDGLDIPQDLFGNVFLGYIGQRSEMSLNSILLGAGIYQIADHMNEPIPNTNGETGANIVMIGDRPTNRDKADDQAALKAGYELGQKCGSNCSQDDIRQVFEQLLKED